MTRLLILYISCLLFKPYPHVQTQKMYLSWYRCLFVSLPTEITCEKKNLLSLLFTVNLVLLIVSLEMNSQTWLVEEAQVVALNSMTYQDLDHRHSLGFEIHVMYLVKTCCLAMGFRLGAHVDLTEPCKKFLVDTQSKEVENRIAAVSF